jgi:ABC-type multidrug transport system fused ATPase/permease subunit
LSIGSGNIVAFVGATGAGKTTAVDLILGLLQPQEGGLYVDDILISDENMRPWQHNIGYVPQHIFLTDDTIAANIAFGCRYREIDMEAVEKAARIANLNDFVVQQLSNGYLTKIGERGVRLSGGQRQRIGIARALYHDPDILIFDEATSALDNLTEKAVMRALYNVGKSKTVIIVAHRLTTVETCDQLFFFERGVIRSAGTYHELLKVDHSFRKMVLSAQNRSK